MGGVALLCKSVSMKFHICNRPIVHLEKCVATEVDLQQLSSSLVRGSVDTSTAFCVVERNDI